MRTRNCNKVTQSFKDVKNLIKSKKARDEQGLFVTEGIKIFSETPMDRVEAVFATAEFANEHPEMIARIPAGTERVLMCARTDLPEYPTLRTRRESSRS